MKNRNDDGQLSAVNVTDYRILSFVWIIFFSYTLFLPVQRRGGEESVETKVKKKRKKEGGYMKRAANKTGGSSGGGGFMAADFESSSSLFSDLPGPPKTTVACFLYPLVEDDSLDLRGKSQKKSASCRCGCDQKSKLWDLFDPWHQTHFAATLGFLFPFLFFCKSRRQIYVLWYTRSENLWAKKKENYFILHFAQGVSESS